MDLLDESKCIDDLGQVLARDAQPLAVAEPDSDENRVKFLELLARDILPHFHPAAKFHP